MNEKINALVKLQEHDSRLEAQAQAKARLAPQREKLKGDIEALLSRMEQGKKSLTQAQVEKKNLELDIESKEQAVRKSTGELNTVKSNEAYKALLTQIEAAKKSKSTIEDRVLEVMEIIENIQKDLKDAEKRVQQEKAGLEQKIAELDAEEKRLDGEWQDAKKVRDEFFQTLSQDVRHPYENLQGSRKKGAVIVPIRENVCGGCQTLLPPSVVNDVVKGKDLISCETCSRILYIPPSPVAS